MLIKKYCKTILWCDDAIMQLKKKCEYVLNSNFENLCQVNPLKGK